MARKNKHKPKNVRPLAQTPGGANQARSDASGVQVLLDAHRYREAVELAKDYHKHTATAASEALLLEAYRLRIQEMIHKGFRKEALALLDLVRGRYPSARAALASCSDVLTMHEGQLDELLKQLAAPDCPAERRAQLEALLETQLDDLRPLAESAVLPEDHELRRGARLLLQALEQVTSGPVEPEALQLREIPRRSPLASWKSLVEAIASYYRGDAEQCRRWLDTIEKDSPPARLVPVLHDLLGDSPPGTKLFSDQKALAQRVRGSGTVLLKLLEDLEGHFDRYDVTNLGQLIRRIALICRDEFPSLYPSLMQHIWLRAQLEDAPMKRITSGLLDPVPWTASFWRTKAKVHERLGAFLTATLSWNEFRKHAIHEAWIQPNGPEEASVYRKMIGCLQLAPAEDDYEKEPEYKEPVISEFRRFLRSGYESQPVALKKVGGYPNYHVDQGVLDVDELFGRVTAMDAHPEDFQRWIDSVLRNSQGTPDYAKLEQIATMWSRAFPKDPIPQLTMLAWAEKRGALRKALTFLDAAEAANPLHPKVRAARLRLLVQNCIKHLKQGKAHLADKDLAELAELPAAREGDRRFLIMGLQLLSEQLKGDTQAVQRIWAELTAAVGIECATLVTWALSSGVGQPMPSVVGREPALPSQGALLRALVRVYSMFADCGFSYRIPVSYAPQLDQDLKAVGEEMSAADLLTAGRAVLDTTLPKLAYSISGIGLLKFEAQRAHFLLLRARSLPPWKSTRRQNCLAAASALARRGYDHELLQQVVDAMQGEAAGRRDAAFYGRLPAEARDRQITPEQIHAVVEREIREPDYDSSLSYGGDQDLLAPPGQEHEEEEEEEKKTGPQWDETDLDDEGFEGVPDVGQLLEEIDEQARALAEQLQIPFAEATILLTLKAMSELAPGSVRSPHFKEMIDLLSPAARKKVKELLEHHASQD